METINVNGDSKTQLSVKLEPFVHQVGGHSSMLCLDESTVCKPLLTKEKIFYETMPDLLKPFSAQYRGTIEVTFFTEDVGGYLTVTAFPPDGYISSENVQHMKHRIRWHHGSCIEIESDDADDRDIFEDDTCTALENGSPCAEHSLKDRRASSHNPWVLRCHRDYIAKVLGLDVASPNQIQLSVDKPTSCEFLLLANLTWRKRRPCVLDVKMGTRQYGDDAPESKRISQSLKVENSTSGSLGIRLCGMQVFQVTTNRYLCRNKYYGRSLNDEGLRSSLLQFLHNGVRLRTEIFPPLLKCLNDLLDTVTQLDSFRFFTSSLLIIYDGYEASEGSSTIADAATNSTATLPWHQSPPAPLGLIDVRIIDFAHSTHRDMGLDCPVYSGPDEGFLFGLKNLIALIEELYKQGS